MNLWRPIPAVRLIIPLITGILATRVITGFSELAALCLPACFIVLLAWYFISFRYNLYRFRWIFGVLVFATLMVGGFNRASRENSRMLPVIPDSLPENGRIFICRLADQLSTTRRGFKTIAELESCYEDGHFKFCRARVLLYFESSLPLIPIFHGDRFLIYGNPERITDRSNPGTFSYTSFMKAKGVEYQISIRKNEWWLPTAGSENTFTAFMIRIRDRLLRMIRELGLTDREYAVTSALLFGYTRDIDPSLKRGYSIAGATHILSVSGMHVGVVYIFLDMLLRFMNRRIWSLRIKSTMIVFAIWFYALLTGMSPPVMRAAAMLSMVIVGITLRRKSEPLNIVAASAVILLFFMPSVLFDIGFQFSYLAVLGLVIFYKPVYDLYVTSLVLPDKIWSILAASMAAQLTTFPVALYYFHQFPNYFLLTNIVVVPLSAWIIYSAMTGLFLAAVPIAGVLAGKIISAEVWLMNSFILWVERLPCSATQGVYITPVSLLACYLMIISIYLWMIAGKRVWATGVIAGLVIIAGAEMFIRRFPDPERQIVVFYVKGASVYDFSASGHSHFFRDFKGAGACGVSTPVPSGHWGERRVTSHSAQFIYPADGVRRNGSGLEYYVHGDIIYLCYYDLRIVILGKKGKRPGKVPFPCDLVILRCNAGWNVEEIRKAFIPRQIIADGSNRYFQAEKWRREAEAAGIPFHSVWHHGAYVYGEKKLPDGSFLRSGRDSNSRPPP